MILIFYFLYFVSSQNAIGSGSIDNGFWTRQLVCFLYPMPEAIGNAN